MEEQAKKKFIMKIGIISFMVLILIFWILNIRNVFQGNPSINNVQKTTESQKLQADFNQAIDKMSQSLDKISATNEKLKTASSSLLSELMAGINNIASSTNNSSTFLATSSLSEASSSPLVEVPASSTPINDSCPPYINCMPSVGEARPCQIPVGCEGITQIAY